LLNEQASAIWPVIDADIDIRACSSPHTFRRLLKTHCFDQAFSSPYRLTQVPQIRPLVDTAHSKGFIYLLTYKLRKHILLEIKQPASAEYMYLYHLMQFLRSLWSFFNDHDPS